MHEAQLEELKQRISQRNWGTEVTMADMPNGGTLIRVVGIPLTGWNRTHANVLFVAPPGYPSAMPDCFWVEEAGLRLANGDTPQNTNDSNPIPGDTQPRSATWFSWHVQSWNPNKDSLTSFFHSIMDRLRPAR